MYVVGVVKGVNVFFVLIVAMLFTCMLVSYLVFFHAVLHRVTKIGLPWLPMLLMLQSLLVATSLSPVVWT